MDVSFNCFTCCFQFCVCFGQVAIHTTWNGVASEGKKGVLAVRTEGEIVFCEWASLDVDEPRTYT